MRPRSARGLGLELTGAFALVAGALLAAVPARAADVRLDNRAGVEVVVADTPRGYALGRLSLNREPVETALSEGIIRFLNVETGTEAGRTTEEESCPS